MTGEAEASTLPDEGKASKPWLKLIEDARKAFRTWDDKCDNIDKLYADLKALASGGTDREMQLFWANMEVLRPSVYNREPVPVVAPKFRDRRELPRAASEILERALVSDFEADDLHETLKLVRDDLLLAGRGVPWLRYANRGNSEAVLCEHVGRKDFLHDPARKWAEVQWVAKRAYLSRLEMKKRFDEVGLRAQFEGRDAGTDKEDSYKTERKAEVWEIWHKGLNVVCWVSPGLDEILDQKEPFLDLERFFPCPRPAYGTAQRDTLIPVPDFVYYKDQIEEINELTARISALSEALRLRGFYAGGASDVADAVEAAMRDNDNNATLRPIANMHQLSGGALKDAVLWMPLEEVANTIANLIQLRKQLIEDVYEITGLSDIMRGATDAQETATAQQIKSQYGSIRLQEKQAEMVRLARDVTRIKGEIMAEVFKPDTLLIMSQVEMPSQADVQMQMQQAQMQGQQVEPQVALEDVMSLLRSQRLRPFVLEIETDSTIQPNEDAEKQRRTEFLTAVGGFLAQSLPLVATQPEAAPFVAEALKFTAGGFRAGRQMDAAIDEFAEKIKEVAAQPRPDPAQMEAELKAKMEEAKLQLESRKLDIEEQRLMLDAQKGEPPEDKSIEAARLALDWDKEAAKAMLEVEKLQLERDRMERGSAD